ncbi:hypothetical protein K2173_017217 [Erythroxylum novogranatense]|uniref:DYW domain-containing protein n=1 Tax=Erythroxylum novogranatense TaxID=1862640 RepID=A0AAV8U656_9ROSI|nr:hypothetical protein K2173_017217 [Erythroxylum novogranatense]
MRWPVTKSKLLRATTRAPAVGYTRAVEQSCLSLLDACNKFSKLTQLHSRIIKSGLQNNRLVLTKFAATASALCAIDYASTFIFLPESDPYLYDVFLFNTVIRAYAQTSDLKSKALCNYNLMLRCSVLPNKYTYPFVLKACAGIGDLRLGKSIHGSVLKLGFHDDLYVQNTMVHMYWGNSDGVELARKVFDEMPKFDSVSWTVMISGYARLGMSHDAIGLFREMQIAGVCADEITMVSVLSACTDLGALELGKWVEFYIGKQRIQKKVELWNALIDMYAKCGDIDKAIELFRSMNDRSIVSWTSVIVGLAMHGRGIEAVALFEEMVGSGVVPDDVVFIGLLSACSHSGLVEKGKQYFDFMRTFGLVPKIEHCGCMVDLLCRAGLVKEAFEFIQDMPIEPNPVVWRTLVNACGAQGLMKLGEKISRQLIKNQPLHESNYVLLSNIYAKMLNWGKKTNVREVMDKKGMRKIPGSTMIELDNQIYEFVAGDRSHEQCEEMYQMVEEMGRKIKNAGYLPATSEVMLDINDEDKEDALYHHSEKLAIAFALLNTPPETPIRIVKNLRVCKDCHAAIKLISKVYNREIVMRDRNRFHLFKDGFCSCRDFW